MLGCSSIKITQEYYGKIVQRRVSEEMKKSEELTHSWKCISRSPWFNPGWGHI